MTWQGRSSGGDATLDPVHTISQSAPEDGSVERRRLTVAVDGPSGSGKSSVCREVARRLGISYLDTGAMYRAVCWSCLDHAIDLDDTARVVDRAIAMDLVMSLAPDVARVLVDGHDVTTTIRTSRVSMAVSDVAANPGVRQELVRRQRDLMSADPAGCIAEGRDITTVVAPDADVRILLTADPASRISRRARQLHGDVTAHLSQVTAAEVVGRDDRDSLVVDFHRPAHGVIALDSSDLDLEETVARVLTEIAAAVRWEAGIGVAGSRT